MGVERTWEGRPRLNKADKLAGFFGCELTEPVWERIEKEGE